MYWDSQNIRRYSKERLTYRERARHESFEEYNHYYNEKGYVYKSVKTGNVVEDEYKETITYTYDSYDENGNWTKRTCKLVGKLTSGGGGYYDSKKETHTETRKITYYGTSASKDKNATKSTDSKKSTKSKDSKKSSSKEFKKL